MAARTKFFGTLTLCLVIGASMATSVVTPDRPATSLTGLSRSSAGAHGLSLLPNMFDRRSSHTATLLPNGQVLIVGGMQRNGAFLRSAELYDPRDGSFARAAAQMSTPRVGHCATVLPNGKVLITGGWSREGVLASAELYDPGSGAFSSTGNMTIGRGDFTATLLRNGKVLVSGGENAGAVSSAEIYDTEAGSFSRTGSMHVGRTMHAASLLMNGDVLITGGGQYRQPVSDAEVYDALAGRFVQVGTMSVAGYKHATVVLPAGDVLVVGGSDGRDWQGQHSSAEVYSVKTRSFTSAGVMNSARFKLPNSAVLLKNGKVFVTGGSARLELFDPATKDFMALPGHLDVVRFYATSTLLNDGTVLVVGGYDAKGEATAGAWLYRP